MKNDSSECNRYKKLKIVFAGTPIFSAQCLQSLINFKYNIVTVITKEKKKRGRGKIFSSTPVEKIAKKYFIPILQISSFKNEKKIKNKLISINADLMIVVSYGLLIPKKIINIFPLGCINVHPSLLPRWRGAAPIQYSILHGDRITGVTIIKMNKTIDSGRIMFFSTYLIKKKETALSLEKNLYKLSIYSIIYVLKKLEKRIIIKTIKQDKEKITYSYKLKKQDAKINWNLPAITIDRQIRAFNPWPISYFLIRKEMVKVIESSILPDIKNYKPGEIIKIQNTGLQIKTTFGILNVIKIQFSGKKIITIRDFINSKKTILFPGLVLY